MLGAFTIIKNEAHWVGFSMLAAAKAGVRSFTYFDGDSTDGTPELIEYVAKKYDLKALVVRDMDPKNLQEDYVRVFNECLEQVEDEFAFFLHPDMICYGEFARSIGNLAYWTEMRSFAGNPSEQIFEFSEGRTNRWKNIMANRLGLHYHGFYGAWNEDMYFKEVTGSEHFLHSDFDNYPYPIGPSGIRIQHYSDVRPYARRLERMKSCMLNQGINPDHAPEHPRVSLQSSGGFRMEPTMFTLDHIFFRHNEEFANVLGKRPEEFCFIQKQGVEHAPA